MSFFDDNNHDPLPAQRSPDAADHGSSYFPRDPVNGRERAPQGSSLPNTGELSTRQTIPDRAELSQTPSEHERLSPNELQSYLGDTGCMQIFNTDNVEKISTAALLMDPQHEVDDIPHGLMQSYLETYFKYIHLWCPVLDKKTPQMGIEAVPSLMLRHAIAICGTHLRPPLIAHASSLDHYRRAKGLFYASHPDSPIYQLCAIMLFHWYRLDQPNLIGVDSNWWWITTSIHLAQQIGLHREPIPGQPARSKVTPALSRRIWWTLYVSSFPDTLIRSHVLILAEGSRSHCSVGPRQTADHRPRSMRSANDHAR